MNLNELIAELKAMGDAQAAAGITRYGIKSDRALGISIPKLQALAKKIGIDRKLAGQLWASAIHEARILACMIEDPQQLTDSLSRFLNKSKKKPPMAAILSKKQSIGPCARSASAI